MSKRNSKDGLELDSPVEQLDKSKQDEKEPEGNEINESAAQILFDEDDVQDTQVKKDLPKPAEEVDVQGTPEENAILRQCSTDQCTIRWYRKHDYQRGFLQLISLEPLKQFCAQNPSTEKMMKPYANSDEMMSDFDKLFPSRKEQVKIIVAEVDNMIVFALHLFIDGQGQGRVGHIHDLLINRNCYG